MSKECEELHLLFASLKKFEFPFDSKQIPQNGIYILFERGEAGHGTSRIVRVGTHTGKNQLRSRLEQHFVRENKDRSIFRKNIGRAILSRDKDPFIHQWEIDLTTREAKEKFGSTIDIEKKLLVEKIVSEYIQNNFQFVVFAIEDKEERMLFESKIISTLSACKECGPSDNWLGQYSPKQKIQQSGLWLVNGLNKKPLSENEINRLKTLTKAI